MRSMSHVKGYVSPNRPLSVRVRPDGRKQEFIAVAHAAGDVPSDLVNDFISWYMGYSNDLPVRPTVERQGHGSS
jgi:hypothetical protein